MREPIVHIIDLLFATPLSEFIVIAIFLVVYFTMRKEMRWNRKRQTYLSTICPTCKKKWQRKG